MREMAMLQEVQPDRLQIAKAYVQEVYESIQARNPGELEFHQAAKEIFDSLGPSSPSIQSTWRAASWSESPSPRG